MKKMLLVLGIILCVIADVIVASASEGEWTCTNCGNVTTGNFCNNCGTKKPDTEWICPNCGQTTSGNFCNLCGAKKPDNAESEHTEIEDSDKESTDAGSNSDNTDPEYSRTEFENTVITSDWNVYDELIFQIYQETDLSKREALMHQAEEELMHTWAIVPLYFYNDVFMMKTDCTGAYCNLFGFKYLAYMHCPNNVLNACFSSEPDHIDPALISSADDASLVNLAFSGLYTYDANGNLVPELADGAPKVSADCMTYSFKMKDGLTWSDGDVLDAKDVVYSWNRLANPNTAADYSFLCEFANIAVNSDGTLAIEASDDGSDFTVHLTRPCAYFLDLCAFPAFYPVPEQAVAAADPYGENPGAWALESGFVTSGPMTCTGWGHNEYMTFEKNVKYWNAENVTLDRINLMLSGDETAIYSAYNDGSLQFIDSIPVDKIAGVITNDDFFINPNLGTYYVCFNVNSPVFEGKTPEQAAAMRKAFSLLIDRQYIVDTIGQTRQQPAGTFIPTGMADGQGGIFTANDGAYTYPVTWNFNGAKTVGYYDPTTTGSRRVEEAIMLLKEAGFEFNDDGILSDATPITLEYLTNDGTGHIAIAESIQRDLALVGVNMEIQSEEWNDFLEDRKNGQFDLVREGWLADYNDPINMLEMWLTNSENNDAQFGQ